MAVFDEIFKNHIRYIISNGTPNTNIIPRTVWKDGENAYTTSVWGRTLRFKPEDGFPMLTIRPINFRSLSSEILWMMQKHSNNVLVLQKMGSHVWDEWISEGDPTIGKAYGYQYDNQRIAVPVKDISDKALTIIGSDALTALVHSYKNYPDHKLLLPQPEWALQQLCDNPSSREIMMNVYIPNDLPEMKLAPCAFGSHWEIRNGKLCTSVFIRSSDTMLGLPFNITQYATIQYMWAYLLKVPVGDLVVHLDDAHIYDRHIDRLTDPKDSFLERETFTAPKFWISKDVQSFQDFKYGENFCVIEYFYGKKMHFEVAIGRDELKELRKKQNNEKK